MAWWPDEATSRYGATTALKTTAAARSPRPARAAATMVPATAVMASGPVSAPASSSR